jgi:hypothetical protein
LEIVNSKSSIAISLDSKFFGFLNKLIKPFDFANCYLPRLVLLDCSKTPYARLLTDYGIENLKKHGDKGNNCSRANAVMRCGPRIIRELSKYLKLYP